MPTETRGKTINLRATTAQKSLIGRPVASQVERHIDAHRIVSARKASPGEIRQYQE